MFERFSPEARAAVSRAADEARGLGHGHIGTEHLLLGLIGATGTTASEALVGAGAFLLPAREKVIEALSARSPRSAAGAAGGDLPYTDRAARALDRSGKLSLRMGREQVRCEHILLSVLDVEGTAGQVLRGLGVEPDVVRNMVTSVLSGSHRPTASVHPAEQPHSRGHEPTCGTCGSPLAASLARATMRIAGGSSPDQVYVYYCGACGTAIGAHAR